MQVFVLEYVFKHTYLYICCLATTVQALLNLGQGQLELFLSRYYQYIVGVVGGLLTLRLPRPSSLAYNQ